MNDKQDSRELVDRLLRNRPPIERVGLLDSPWGDTIAKWVAEEGYPTDDDGNAVSAETFFGFDIARSFREHACCRVIRHAVDTRYIADHIVVKHGLDAPATCQSMISNNGAAKQALLFTGQCRVDDTACELVAGQDPRRFDRTGQATRIIIGARRF